MNELEIKFKSNIKCAGCIANVKPILDGLSDVRNWQVDILTPNKILTVMGNEGVEEKVINAIKAAGYTLEKIEE